MTQQGAALQTYNNELVKSVEELKARRAALQTTIKQETEERDRLEGERARLEERLALVGTSLAERVAQGREYDRIIHEAEQAYSKILESSQVLLNVVQSRSADLREGPRGEAGGPRGEGRKPGGGGPMPRTTPDSGFHQAK